MTHADRESAGDRDALSQRRVHRTPSIIGATKLFGSALPLDKLLSHHRLADRMA